MTVAHDAVSALEWTTSPATPATFVHTPVGVPKGVLILAGRTAGSGDIIQEPTYGGVATPLVDTAADTAGETGRVYAFFAGSGLPTGAQTVSVPYSAAAQKFAVCATVTAAADTEIVVSGKLQEDQANPQIALDSLAVSALRYLVLYSGLQSLIDLTLLADQTDVSSNDLGNFLRLTARQTTAGTGSFTVGYTAASDDVAMVAVAIQEVAVGGVVLGSRMALMGVGT